MRTSERKDKSERTRRIKISIMLFTSMVSLLSLAFASFAWLAMNREVESRGAQIEAEVTPNLIISADPAALCQSGFLASAADPFSVGFSGDAKLLRPATHDGSVGGTLLKYNTNPGGVDPKTGVAAGSGSLSFQPVPVEGSSGPHYYSEYKVYIAADGKAMESQILKASISKTSPEDGLMKDNLYASSVDFYVWDTASGQSAADAANFKGTLNLAKLDQGNSGQDKDSLVLIDDGSIPVNTSGYITVLMRYYFDGALLKKNSNKAYVRSTEISPEELGLLVSFEAKDVE